MKESDEKKRKNFDVKGLHNVLITTNRYPSSVSFRFIEKLMV